MVNTRLIEDIQMYSSTTFSCHIIVCNYLKKSQLYLIPFVFQFYYKGRAILAVDLITSFTSKLAVSRIHYYIMIRVPTAFFISKGCNSRPITSIFRHFLSNHGANQRQTIRNLSLGPKSTILPNDQRNLIRVLRETTGMYFSQMVIVVHVPF